MRNAINQQKRSVPIDPSATVKVFVHKPRKTPDTYKFLANVSWEQGSEDYTFGFQDPAGAIKHHPIWDGLYPLLELTNIGGPVFGKFSGLVEFSFDFAVSDRVAAYFEAIGPQLGFDIRVTTERTELNFDTSLGGNIVTMGGGKDSRLMLGTLRELGLSPKIVSANSSRLIEGLQNVRSIETIGKRLTSRMLPAMMELPNNIYHGSGLGEAHLNRPLHRYSSYGSPFALKRLNALLKSLGTSTELHAPQSVLPYNITQRILSERYPDLYRGQYSTEKDAPKEKNLHISLIKAIHGIDYTDHCSTELFKSLVRRFVRANRKNEERQFGFRNNREVIVREMRHCIFLLSQRGHLPKQRLYIPQHWYEPWADKVHTYVNPQLNSKFLDIYLEYGQEFDRMNDAYQLPASLAALLALEETGSKRLEPEVD
ncbi:hypothetical protein FIU94_04600 [Sulfitobacter sp. THAF37]|uniref:hypothetical protein n=1 Tax=Sulfitobacter sp. THAF37 TaxID=2587855 RepID=UPI001268F268|nr:hypothetical protein [Sulfitobacter sp. THAF37]QFT58094.1 hypothetical protein FIU94_04600 [Sulfitobacter sp. THAF37]